MVEQTRRNLNKFTGMLIESFVPFDKDSCLSFQAGLLALHTKTAGQDGAPNLYAIRDDAALKAALKEHGISPADNKVATQDVLSGKGMPRDVPVLGMIAVTLGHISRETKDRLMAAQGAERTMLAAEQILLRRETDAPEDALKFVNGTIRDGRDPAKEARFFIGGFGKDPAYLASAQAVNHLGDMLSGAVGLNPSLRTNKEVRRAMTDLKKLAHGILSEQATHLKKNSITQKAGTDIEAAAKSYGRIVGGHTHLKRLSDTLNRVSSHLVKMGKLSPGDGLAMSRLCATRTVQAEKGLPIQKRDLKHAAIQAANMSKRAGLAEAASLALEIHKRKER